MKKVFIGCGIAVLLGLLGLGYVLYQLWPNVTKVHREWTAAIEQLNALDAQYPFDAKQQAQLDPARFELMLDVRIELADYFTTFAAQMDAMEKSQAERGGPGWIGSLQQFFDQLAPVLTEFASRLKAAGMSPREFAWHTRVMWAVLKRVDDNLAGPELEELRGRYEKFSERYEAMRREQPELVSLDEYLLANLPPAALKSAEQLMAKDLGRVNRALAVTDVDHLYMQPVQRIEDVERIEPLAPAPGATQPVPPEPAPR
jgi:hypothetical protein